MLFSLKKKWRVILLACLLFLVILAALPGLLSWTINTDYTRSKLSDFLDDRTGIELTTRRLNVSLFPRFLVYIKGIEINIDPRTSLVVDKIAMYPDIDFLWKRKFKVDRVMVENISFIHSGSPSIAAGSIPAADTISRRFTRTLTSKDWSPWVADIFSFLPPEQDNLRLVFKGVDTPVFKNLDVDIMVSRNRQSIDISAHGTRMHVKRRMLDRLIPAEKQDDLDKIQVRSAEAKSISLDAKIPVKGMVTGRLDLEKTVVKSFSDDQAAVVTDDLSLTFSLSAGRVQAQMLPSSFTYPNGTISIDFSFQNNQQSKITFAGKSVNIEQARAAAQDFIHGSEVSSRLFWILKKGKADHISVSFSSPGIKDLFDEHHLELSGKVTGGAARIPETDLVVSGIDGAAFVENGVLTIQTETGLLKGSSIQKGNLAVDLANHNDIEFSGRYDLDIDLQDLPSVLVSLLPNTLLAAELEKIDSVSGKARATLVLKRKTGQADVSVEVDADHITGQGVYQRIPGRIVIDRCKFRYQEDRAGITEFSGQIHNQRLKGITAWLDLSGTPGLTVESGRAQLDLETLVPWACRYDGIKRLISPVEHATGTVHVDTFQLQGAVTDFSKWKYRITGQMAGADLFMGRQEPGIAGASCNFDIENGAGLVDAIRARVFQTAFLDTWSKTGYTEAAAVPFDIDNGQLAITPDESFFSGTLEFSDQATMVLHAGQQNPSGKYQIKHLALEDLPYTKFSMHMAPEAADSAMVLSGTLDSRSLKKIMDQDSPFYKRIFSHTNGRNFIIESDTDTSDQYLVTTSYMNADSFFSPNSTDTTASDTDFKTLLGKKSIKLEIDEVVYKKLHLTRFDALVKPAERFVDLTISRADLCGLKTSGRIRANAGRVVTDIDIRGKAYNELDHVISCLFSRPGLIQGPFQLHSRLKADGSPDNFSRAFQGDLVFTADQGRIYKLTLLSRILSFLNVSKLFKGKMPDMTQTGFAYERFEISASIADSRIQLEKAVIDGHDMTLVFTGWIDPIDNQLSLTCLVAPFKTVDMIISRIPILSTMLDNRLVSIPVKATGSIDDPVVVPMHPASVGEGLVNLMIQILKTPVTLMDDTQ